MRRAGLSLAVLSPVFDPASSGPRTARLSGSPSFPRRREQFRRDVADLILLQLGINRQRQHLGAGAVGFGEGLVGGAEVGEAGLAVEGEGVIDGGADVAGG